MTVIATCITVCVVASLRATRQPAVVAVDGDAADEQELVAR